MINNKLNILFGCSAILGGAQAKITDDSHLWNNSAWYDEANNLGVNENGEVYSRDEAMNRFIRAPLTLEGKV